MALSPVHDPQAPEHDPETIRISPVAVAAGVVAALALTGVGLFLWARQGEAVFVDIVAAAIAWCF
jgi:hypothetical protein